MANKKYYWLKLKEDFFEEDAISWIEEQENGKDYCLFYLKLCLKSLKTNGLLIRNVGSMLVPYDIKTLSRVTNTEPDTVRVAMELFKRIGLVQILENGEIYISELQNMVGSETSKAQLMRNKRQKDKKVIESGNNVTPMLPDSYSNEENCYTEIEIDIDKEIEKEKEKEIDIDKDNLSKFAKLYEANLGLINGVSAEWLQELCETIDYKLFKRSIEIATDRNKCSPGYVKGIIKQWLDSNIKTYDQLKAYELQKKSQKGVNSDVRGREGTFETKSTNGDPESEEARRRELLEQCRRLDED